MPRNRRGVDAEAKQRELVAAATDLFVARGYDATPISIVAEQAGVTTNTVYWYFADKEQLLIAVLDALMTETLNAYQRLADRSLEYRLAWVVHQLQAVSQLIATVHSRVQRSERLRDWHDGFHTAVHQLLIEELDALGVSPKRIATEADIITFAVEGLITHHSNGQAVRAMCHALVDRYTS